MTEPYDVVMFIAIVVGAAVALYALGRHHGYERGWIDAIDGRVYKSRRSR